MSESGAGVCGTELREMINANLDELSPLLRTAFVLARSAGLLNR